MARDRIFINYRRADTRWAASRLFDDLGRRFGVNRLYMDVDSIPAGADFVTHLSEHVDQCAAVLVLIGRDWLTLETAEGKRRIDDPSDFVTFEITRALERGIPVVPVLVDGAEMPDAAALPEAIRPLCRRQAVRIGHESYRGDFDQIAAAISPLVGGGRRKGLRIAAVAAALLLGVGVLGGGAYFLAGGAEPAQPQTIVGLWRHGRGMIDWGTDDHAIYDWNGDQGVLDGSFDGRVFIGHWREETSDQPCPTPRAGSRFWGQVKFVFDPELKAFDGQWGYCDDALAHAWNGTRRE